MKIKDEKTGRVFCVEPIDNSKKEGADWGDVDPVSKKLTGDYGKKHRGSIKEKESKNNCYLDFFVFQRVSRHSFCSVCVRKVQATILLDLFPVPIGIVLTCVAFVLSKAI